MFAAMIVIVLGVVLCGFISAVSSTERSAWAFGIATGVGALMVVWMIWYRYSRNRASGLGFWHMFGRSHRDDGIAAQYRPRKVKDGRTEIPAGTNQPITAEEAKQIQENSANAWVPSKNREGGKP